MHRLHDMILFNRNFIVISYKKKTEQQKSIHSLVRSNFIYTTNLQINPKTDIPFLSNSECLFQLLSY